MRRLEGGQLLVATHNRGKLEEIAALMAPYGITVTSNADHALPEPPETGTTFVANARIKAIAGMQAVGIPALADDSGLSVAALDGAPGVYSADWAEKPDGSRDFAAAMACVRDELQAKGADAPWRARFTCALVLVWPDGHEEVFEGHVPGQIIWPGRGDQGHGYDPIFLPDGYDVTFGEMDRWEKNRISHRGRAFEQLVAGCLA